MEKKTKKTKKELSKKQRKCCCGGKNSGKNAIVTVPPANDLQEKLVYTTIAAQSLLKDLKGLRKELQAVYSIN